MTALDLINASLKRIAVIQAGESPSPEDAALGLEALQLLIDLWATQRLTISSITRTTFTITANVATYTVGTGGTVNVARPATSVITVNLIDTNTNPDTEVPLMPLTDDAYSLIPQKAVTSSWPTSYYWNPTYGITGFATITFWPVPTASGLQGVFYAPLALTEPAAFATDIYTPPGYRVALIDNLAVRLCPDFGKRVSPDLAKSADDTLGWIKRSNSRLSDLSIDAALTRHGRSNIYLGHV